MPSLHKLRLVLSSTGSILLLTVVLYAVLNTAARWGEIDHHGYPWRQEDYLRILLPSLYENRGDRRIFLAGPSESREALIYQRFDAAFPEMEAFQSGQSLGTFADLLISLEYMNRVYGPDARPRTLVLGITPRFVANIITSRQPLVVASIDRYSPYYSVAQTPDGFHLVPKTTWEGLASRARFLPKLKDRYQTMIAALVNRAVNDTLPYEAYPDSFFPQVPTAQTARQTLREWGVWTSLGRWSAIYISPYKYHHLRPRPEKVIDNWIQDPSSFWAMVHARNLDEDAALIQRQFDRLLTLADQWHMRVYVVNLPEHPLNQAGYQPGAYERYLELVRASLKDTPFLDLRDMIPADGFYDAGHVTLPNALRVTDRIIAFMKTHNESP